MIDTNPFDIYDLALTVRVRWQAHSLSTAGTNGSNRLMPRRQLLSNGQETDAAASPNTTMPLSWPNIAKPKAFLSVPRWTTSCRPG